MKSNDNKNFEVVDTIKNNSAEVTNKILDGFTARYVQIAIQKGRQTDNLTGVINEFQLYGVEANSELKKELEQTAQENIIGTPPPKEPENLALNKKFFERGSYAESYNGARAFDGNASTFWYTNDPSKTLTVDLGEECVISRYVIKHHKDFPSEDFVIQKSSDNKNWTDVDSVNRNFNALTDKTVNEFTAQYVRIIVKKNTGNIAVIVEFEVWGNKKTDIQSSAASTTSQFSQNSTTQINLALGKTATASSSENTTNIADKSFDGNGNTRWASIGGVDPQWIMVDLGAEAAINKVVLTWEAAAAKVYKIQVSNDGNNWIDVASVTDGTSNENREIAINNAKGRYARMYGTTRANTWYGYSIWEFEVCGTFTGAAQTAQQTQSSNQISVNDGKPKNGSFYKLQAKHSGLLLSVENSGTVNGSNVSQQPDNNLNSQIWKLEDMGSGYFKLVNKNSGKCLDVSGGSTSDGGNIHQWDYANGANQVWKFNDADNGYYKIIPKHIDKAVDVSGGSKNTGANIQLWSHNTGDGQKWKLIEITDAQQSQQTTTQQSQSQTTQTSSTQNSSTSNHQSTAQNITQPTGDDVLTAGKKLQLFQRLTSKNGEFRFVFESDQNNGYFQLYDKNNNKIWRYSNLTFCEEARMNADGKLAAYSKAGVEFWKLDAPINAGNYLKIEDNGSVAIYDKNNKAVFTWFEYKGPTGEARVRLNSGEELKENEKIYHETDKSIYLEFYPMNQYRAAGWLMLKKFSPYSQPREKTLWEVSVQKPKRCVMEKNGNLVIYDENGRIGWESQTEENPGAYAVIGDENTLKIMVDGKPALTREERKKAADKASPKKGQFYYLYTGAELKKGEYITNGNWSLKFSENGYMELIKSDYSGVKTIFSTKDKGVGERCVIENNNNMVVYGSGNKVLWESDYKWSGQAEMVYVLDSNGDFNLMSSLTTRNSPNKRIWYGARLEESFKAQEQYEANQRALTAKRDRRLMAAGRTIKKGEILYTDSNNYEWGIPNEKNCLRIKKKGDWQGYDIFDGATQITFDASGNLYVYNQNNSIIVSYKKGWKDGFVELFENGKLLFTKDYQNSETIELFNMDDAKQQERFYQSFGDKIRNNNYYRLEVGDEIKQGQKICNAKSVNDFYWLTLQTDGNLALYSMLTTDGKISSSNGKTQIFTRWATGANKNNSRLKFEADGNLVLYNSSNQKVWETGTAGYTGLAHFVYIEPDYGDIIIADKLGNSLATCGYQKIKGNNSTTNASTTKIIVVRHVEAKNEPSNTTAQAGKPKNGSSYKIQSKHSGMLVSVDNSGTNNGANVSQQPDNNLNSQIWKLEDMGGGYFKLVNKNSGKCLDVSGGSTTNGGNLHQWDYANGNNQVWKFEETSNGYYKILVKHVSKCIDIAGGSKNAGGNIQQWDYAGGDNQQWKLIEVK